MTLKKCRLKQHLTHSLTRGKTASTPQGAMAGAQRAPSPTEQSGRASKAFKENLFQEIILRGKSFILSV